MSRNGNRRDAHATTDAAGHYRFDDLDGGHFILNISAPGFLSIVPAVSLIGTIQADFALVPE